MHIDGQRDVWGVCGDTYTFRIHSKGNFRYTKCMKWTRVRAGTDYLLREEQGSAVSLYTRAHRHTTLACVWCGGRDHMCGVCVAIYTHILYTKENFGNTICLKWTRAGAGTDIRESNTR